MCCCCHDQNKGANVFVCNHARYLSEISSGTNKPKTPIASTVLGFTFKIMFAWFVLLQGPGANIKVAKSFVAFFIVAARMAIFPTHTHLANAGSAVTFVVSVAPMTVLPS